jgi:hypothetical protein
VKRQRSTSSDTGRISELIFQIYCALRGWSCVPAPPGAPGHDVVVRRGRWEPYRAAEVKSASWRSRGRDRWTRVVSGDFTKCDFVVIFDLNHGDGWMIPAVYVRNRTTITISHFDRWRLPLTPSTPEPLAERPESTLAFWPTGTGVWY